MLAITGATGHLGHATIQALLNKIAPSELIAVVRDPQKAASLRQQSGQIRPGDYNDTASLIAAFQGVDTVLFISTNEVDHDLRVQQHRNVVDAAKQAGVRHIVYTSALNPTPDSFFTGSASHLATEHYLQESGLTYTIFRNTLYLDVLPDFIGAQTLLSSQLYAAVGTGKVSYALREEIAQALATVLTEPGHENQTYDIAPGPAYSMQDIAATLSEVTGQSVTYVPISPEDLATGMRQHQVPEPIVTVMVGLTKAMAANELNVASPTLAHVLGRKPTDLKAYLTTVYAAK